MDRLKIDFLHLHRHDETSERSDKEVKFPSYSTKAAGTNAKDMAPRIRYAVPDLEDWIHPDFTLQSAGGRQQDSLQDFVTRRVLFEYELADDDLWHYDQFLGNGAFGLVGLWQKRDPAGHIIDEFAVKETFMPDTGVLQLRPNTHPLPEEVIIQTDLQRKGCVPVVQIRGLNVIEAPPGSQDRIRYYMEYCPKGSLEDVLLKYSTAHEVDQNSDAHVPEPFLWQVLLSFAEVMVSMEQKPFDHPQAADHGSDPYVLHFDIKLENIFLGVPEDEDPIKHYPAVKVGDWGLAKLTDLQDSRNSRDWKGRGSRMWFPPEQFQRNRFGANWASPDWPPWRSYPDQDDYQYRTGHSVFAFASVIFRLMKLDVEYHALEDLIRLASLSPRACVAKAYRFIGNEHMDRNWFGQQTPYSDALKKMIADCLNLDPMLRPSPMIIRQLAHRQCTLLAARQFQGDINTFEELRFQGPKHWTELGP